ncbi:hypothetical protein Tcan_17956 [Toxocara canis]|uniref:Uncharacterized protein n=1 Tax=Toxocara canis TaxID=6265 RepID=A0A0B2VHU6_TOXCA|nr:hypothetical protein Tcan_17956 [Toxocara canis]
MSGGGSLPTPRGPPIEGLSETQDSYEGSFKEAETKNKGLLPLRNMDLEDEHNHQRDSQQKDVVQPLFAAAITDPSITPSSGRPKDAMNTASSPLRVEPTQEDSICTGGDMLPSTAQHEQQATSTPISTANKSLRLPTGADIFDIQSLQDVATQDDTLSNIVLQKLGCFPTCFQFTLLRLSAMMLLLAAWSTMIFFPCVHLEYTQVASANISDRHQMEMTIEQTCPADPLWWVEETIFINDVISQSSYYKTLNETNEKLEKQLYETDRAESIRYPLNGQKFVISGCLLLSFPLLISIMVFRCTFQGDDFMEEAMLDIVQIALFIVFAVVEGYLSSAVELRLFWKEICHLYVAAFDADETKKEVFDVCTKAKMVPYGIITAGIIFIILALIFSIDFIILLKHSERLEAQKFLLMAVSLRKEMGLEGMNISIQQELESYKAAMEKFAPSIFNSITLSGYLSSAVELRLFWKEICHLYVAAFDADETKKEVFDVCTKAKMVPYGIITAGIIFIILALIFSIDFIILLKHSERLEAQKFLLMAVSLRKEMGLEGMNISIQQELESYKAAMENLFCILSGRKGSSQRKISSR